MFVIGLSLVCAPTANLNPLSGNESMLQVTQYKYISEETSSQLCLELWTALSSLGSAVRNHYFAVILTAQSTKAGVYTYNEHRFDLNLQH